MDILILTGEQSKCASPYVQTTEAPCFCISVSTKPMSAPFLVYIASLFRKLMFTEQKMLLLNVL